MFATLANVNVIHYLFNYLTANGFEPGTIHRKIWTKQYIIWSKTKLVSGNYVINKVYLFVKVNLNVCNINLNLY